MSSEELEKEVLTVERISSIQEGESVFESHGISRVKVTKDGKVKVLEFPIKSTGVAELIDTFSEKAPKPPDKKILIDPDSELGRELGLNKKKPAYVPDFNDPDYVQAKEKHNSDLGIAIMIQGLDIEIKDKEGKVVTDRKGAVKILKESGLTGEQFTQIVEDIQDLTRWADEEERDFFGKD